MENIVKENIRIYDKAINKIEWLLDDIESYNTGKFRDHVSYKKIKTFDNGNVNWLNFIRLIYLVEQYNLTDYYLLKKKVHFNSIKKVLSDIISEDKNIEDVDKKKFLSTFKNLKKEQFVKWLSSYKYRKKNKSLTNAYKVIENSNSYKHKHRLETFLLNFAYFNNIIDETYYTNRPTLMEKLETFVDNYNNTKINGNLTNKALDKVNSLYDKGKLNFKAFEKLYFDIMHKERFNNHK